MRLLRNSLYTLTSSVLPAIISVVTIPFFVTQIGAERYGVLSIAWLVLGYFGSADFGIGRAITQRIAAMRASGEGSPSDAVCSALLAMAGFGLITAILLFIFTNWYFAGPFETYEGLRSEALKAVWILALCSIVVGLNGVLAGALMGYEEFGVLAISNAISNSVIVLFPLATAYLYSIEISYLIASALLARSLGAALLTINVWRKFFKHRLAKFSHEELKPLLGFGLWVMVSSLIGPLMLFVDRFVIGAYLGALAVAAYAIPYQIASRTLLVPVAITQALYPRFAAEDGALAKARCAEFAVFVGQFFALISIVLICLAEPLLRLWLGDLLDPRSVLVAQVLMIGFWANAIAFVPFAYLQARGNPGFTAILHTLELPVFLTLLWAFGTSFGLTGFAIAFSARCIIDCAALMQKSSILWSMQTAKLGVTAVFLSASFLVGTLSDSFVTMLVWTALLFVGVFAAMLFQMPAGLRVTIRSLAWARRFG
ncbi:oligosaccharide flippase family protein [Porphyrobacter sp. AAP82]|uniref:oligosaccharide flippase family protein n=1 Tax=Porphyrobacter sp. AAP82 TaxID=1248917 RepID=UPI0002E7D1D5|nr:oligosaccharide flippase family protein [Porphyrobacter sp. AAP82]